LLSAGVVYGPLAPLAGRVPGLATAYNPRLLVVICFCLAALGGLGLDALLQAPGMRSSGLLAKANWLGAAGLAAVAAAGVAVALRGRSADHWLPSVHGYIGFWLVFGLASLATAVLFIAGGWLGGNRRWAAAGLCTLALIEAAVFAGPYNPREPLSSVPPPSPSVAWLQAHAGGRPIAALGTTLIPESASLYGLTDVRSYDVLIDPRQRIFWSAADPGYDDSNLTMTFAQPGVDWLAAAGVAYVMMSADQSLPGATTAYQDFGVAIAEVPNPRPFVYAATEVVAATDPRQAAALLSRAPLGPVVVEGCCPVAGSAQASVTRRTAGELDLAVVAQSPATIVVQQSYQQGWEAEIDGRPAAILPANVLFQAITVPAGNHVVTLRYRPASVPIGAAMTATGALALVLLAVLPLALRRRARSR
ncbi:MAG: YfhO family protein, partial [Chloroflexota bacterium]